MSDGTIEREEGFSEGYRSRDAEIEQLREENLALHNRGKEYEQEIERLRGELEAKVEKIRSGAWRDEQLAKQATEIEQLRSRIAESERDFAATYESQRTANQAEIERLRREEAHTRVLLQGEKAQAKADKAELRAEIERLRSALEDCQNLDEAPDLRAEIKRLREQAERDCAAINGTYRVQRDLRAEIERLRDLLLTLMLCKGATTSSGTLVLVSPELMQRVREALGDAL